MWKLFARLTGSNPIDVEDRGTLHTDAAEGETSPEFIFSLGVRERTSKLFGLSRYLIRLSYCQGYR